MINSDENIQKTSGLNATNLQQSKVNA